MLGFICAWSVLLALVALVIFARGLSRWVVAHLLALAFLRVVRR